MNTLVNSILRGSWMVEPQWAHSMKPFIKSILEGKISKDDAGKPHSVYLINTSSQEVSIVNENAGFSDAEPESIAVIPLIGAMTKYDSWCEHGTNSRAAQIKAASANDNISGIVILIDSPGGQTSSIEVMHQAITESTKPVIALVSGMCCSAAMGVAAACDKIISDGKLGIIGSIGTMITLADYVDNNIKIVEVYASKSTDKNKLVNEAMNGNTEPLQKEFLDPINELFIEMVTTGRPNLNAAETLTGKVFVAPKALELGLIDEIGNLNSAINSIQTMLGLEYRPLSKYKGKTLSQQDAKEVKRILIAAGINLDGAVQGEKPLDTKSLLYDTKDGKKIHVFADEGEDPIGKECVYADEQGNPTQEPLTAGDHELADGSVMNVEVKDDAKSYVVSITAKAEEEAPTTETPAAKVKSTASVGDLASQLSTMMEQKLESFKSALKKEIKDELVSGVNPPRRINSSADQAYTESVWEKRRKEIAAKTKK